MSRGPVTADPVEPITAGPVTFVLEFDGEAIEDRRMFVYVPSEPGPDIVDAPTTPFVPETTTAGDVTRIPFVWPDGSSATLVYPTELRLADLGVQPNVSYVLRAYPPPRFPVLFLHGPPGVEDPYLVGDQPLKVLTSADGGYVEMCSAVNGPWFRNREVAQRWLVFRTESWSVLVSVARPAKVALSPAEIAAAFSFDELEGYPVALAVDPLMLSNESGEGKGRTSRSPIRPGRI